jgi:hypothetical protein
MFKLADIFILNYTGFYSIIVHEMRRISLMSRQGLLVWLSLKKV